MKTLVIVGAGGFGREVLDWALQSAANGVEWSVKGFLDDNPHALDGFEAAVPLLGGVTGYQPGPEDVFICAMGRVEFKRRCVEGLRARGAVFTRVIHPSAVLSSGARLGEGVILCPHAVVAAGVRLGNFVAVNLHSTVAHDASVGDWSQLHCHVDVTGGAVIGEGVTVGSHASVLPGMRVGDGATVGAGAVVARDVPPGMTVFGVPARPLVARGGEGSHD